VLLECVLTSSPWPWPWSSTPC